MRLSESGQRGDLDESLLARFRGLAAVGEERVLAGRCLEQRLRSGSVFVRGPTVQPSAFAPNRVLPKDVWLGARPLLLWLIYSPRNIELESSGNASISEAARHPELCWTY